MPVCACVCLSVHNTDNLKHYERICTKLVNDHHQNISIVVDFESILKAHTSVRALFRII